jgi:predicted AlkP superfamily phosphohydrolase/phosphomutase
LPQFCFANGLVRFGFLTEEPHTSATLRTRTLWSILSTLGIAVGVVNFPLTYPAQPVRGYLVSEAYARRALTPAAVEDRAMMYPHDLEGEARSVVQQAAMDRSPVLPLTLESDIEERHHQPSRADRTNDRLAQALAANRRPQVELVRYQSLDQIGHYFLRYAVPSAFGDVSAAEQRARGSVLEGHYALIDQAIGREIERLGPDDLLLVVSGYGMEPLGPGKRLLELMIGDPDVSGTHDAAPDGFLMAYGSSVAKARSLRRGSVVDVVPTVLYFLGLPIGRDMDGYARTDLFQAAFTQERPLTFIATYDR